MDHGVRTVMTVDHMQATRAAGGNDSPVHFANLTPNPDKPVKDPETGDIVIQNNSIFVILLILMGAFYAGKPICEMQLQKVIKWLQDMG